MPIKYKLTDQKLQTGDGGQWEAGIWKSARGRGHLRGAGWLTCYDHPLLAAFFNGGDHGLPPPILWKVECKGKMRDDGEAQRGYTKMRLIKPVEMPPVTWAQRIAFAILCVQQVTRDNDRQLEKLPPVSNQPWEDWAKNWLEGKDRKFRTAIKLWSNEWNRRAIANRFVGGAGLRVTAAAAAGDTNQKNAQGLVAMVAEAASISAKMGYFPLVGYVGRGKKLNLVALAKKAIACTQEDNP